MIETPEQLNQAIDQMGRMQRILESYRDEILTKNPRNFAVLAEGPLEQIRQLHAQIDGYVRRLEETPKTSPDREAYWAALRARPVSTWANMPPMISMRSG